MKTFGDPSLKEHVQSKQLCILYHVSCTQYSIHCTIYYLSCTYVHVCLRQMTITGHFLDSTFHKWTTFYFFVCAAKWPHLCTFAGVHEREAKLPRYATLKATWRRQYGNRELQQTQEIDVRTTSKRSDWFVKKRS